MQLDIWHISGDGFHWGRHGLGQEESGRHIPSDTLFAALVARLAELEGAAAAQAFVDAGRGDTPPFVMSSAFPRAGNARFFPTPLRHPTEPKPDGPRPKDLKRVKFVSESLFRAILAGGTLADAVQTGAKLHDGQVVFGGQVVLTPIEHAQLPALVRDDNKLWNVEKRPRVTVGRAAQNSQIYFTGRTAFHQECGLWFGVRWLTRTDTLAQTLESLLLELGDAGLGGVRSSGFGQCKIERVGSLDLPDPSGGLWVTLSRYLPRADESHALRDERSAYAVETIGGWVDSPVRKSERRRAVRMLAEGAVLGPVARAAPGQIVDAQPDYDGKQPLGHPVWRSGLALAVGLKGR